MPLHCLSADDVTNGHDMVQCSYSKYVSPDPGRTVIELSLWGENWKLLATLHVHSPCSEVWGSEICYAKGYSILNFDIDTVVNTLLEMAAQVADFNKDKAHVDAFSEYCVFFTVSM